MAKKGTPKKKHIRTSKKGKQFFAGRGVRKTKINYSKLIKLKNKKQEEDFRKNLSSSLKKDKSDFEYNSKEEIYKKGFFKGTISGINTIPTSSPNYKYKLKSNIYKSWRKIKGWD